MIKTLILFSENYSQPKMEFLGCDSDQPRPIDDGKTVRIYHQEYKPSGVSSTSPNMAPDMNNKLSDRNLLWTKKLYNNHNCIKYNSSMYVGTCYMHSQAVVYINQHSQAMIYINQHVPQCINTSFINIFITNSQFKWLPLD